GLAVVKKIADEHGARVRIANLGAPPDAAGNAVLDSARGAQVSLSSSKLATTVRVAANEPVVTSRAHLEFMATLLVVDDELGIRALLSEILADGGHTIALAGNAAQARAGRERTRPDLV